MYQINKWVAIASLTAGFVLLGVNVFVTREFLDLKALRLATMEVSVDTVLPPLRGFNMAGDEQIIHYGGDRRRTLLFVFSQNCEWCDINWTNWHTVIQHANEERIRLQYVGLAADLPLSYVLEHNIPVADLVLTPEPQDTIAYNLRSTPQLILVDPAGRVENVWTGLLDESSVEDILRAVSADGRGTYESGL